MQPLARPALDQGVLAVRQAPSAHDAADLAQRPAIQPGEIGDADQQAARQLGHGAARDHGRLFPVLNIFAAVGDLSR